MVVLVDMASQIVRSLYFIAFMLFAQECTFSNLSRSSLLNRL